MSSIRRRVLLAFLLLGAPAARAGQRAAGTRAVMPHAVGVGVPVRLGLTALAPLTAGRSPLAQLSPSPAAPVEAPRPSEALSASAAEAIAQARSADEALESLKQLGLIKEAEIPRGETDRDAFLKRIWDGVSGPHTAALFPVDDSWAVPAITVKRGDRTYFIHGVAHGQLYPPNRRDVVRLVSHIKKQGHALYSEHDMPLYYGFSYGLETMDRAINAVGARPAPVAAADRGLPAAAIPFVHALARWSALGGVGYAWLSAALNPGELHLWLVAGTMSLALWLVARGLQPLNRLRALADARETQQLGSPELAEQLRRQAAAFFKPRVKAEDILRLYLPPGPGAASDSLSPRSAAIAAAAAASSAAAVHVLVGYRHAAEIAWRLLGPQGPRRGPNPRHDRSQSA